MTSLISRSLFHKWHIDQVSFDKINISELLDISAALAFYITLSLSPLLILIIASITLINPDLQERFVEQVQLLIGSDGAQTLQNIISASSEKGSAVAGQAVGIVVLAISSSAIFGHLRQSFDKIFSFPAPEKERAAGVKRAVKDFIMSYVFQVGLVISFVLVLAVSLTLSSYLTYLAQYVPLSARNEILVPLFSYLIFSMYFFLMYYFVPSHRISPKVAAIGGLSTSLLFMLGKSLIGLYIAHMGLQNQFGAAGSVVVLMTWIYYSSLIIFLCARLMSILKPQAARIPNAR